MDVWTATLFCPNMSASHPVAKQIEETHLPLKFCPHGPELRLVDIVGFDKTHDVDVNVRHDDSHVGIGGSLFRVSNGAKDDTDILSAFIFQTQ